MALNHSSDLVRWPLLWKARHRGLGVSSPRVDSTWLSPIWCRTLRRQTLVPAPSEVLSAVMAQKQDVAALFDELRVGSPSGDGVTRDTYGPGEQSAHALIEARARAMGLEMRRDHAANLFMTWPGRHRDAPCLMMGSHLDSVGNGGNFDGAAGVVAGLVATRSLQQLGVRPRLRRHHRGHPRRGKRLVPGLLYRQPVGLRRAPAGRAGGETRRHRPQPSPSTWPNAAPTSTTFGPAKRASTPGPSAHSSSCTSSRLRSWSRRACRLRSVRAFPATFAIHR